MVVLALEADSEERCSQQVEKLVMFTKSISTYFTLSPEDLYSNQKLGYLRALQMLRKVLVHFLHPHLEMDSKPG